MRQAGLFSKLKISHEKVIVVCDNDITATTAKIAERNKFFMAYFKSTE